ncbi:MAG: hypothetical protein AseanaTS_03610 [Candidatus Pelagadaptatus aseana]|uniref:hypothetical protein n=1 Tax=Candidatus Pelagadaptatus aseana TaxID=3120508 RepID=UPI0039B1AFD2
MNTFRELSSCVLFMIALLLLFEIFTAGFSWVFAGGSVVFFVLAYLVWPSKKKGQRNDDHWYLDVLEVVIELPIELVLRLFRFLARVAKDKDGGFDLDI